MSERDIMAYIRHFYPFAATAAAGIRAFQREFGGLAVNGTLTPQTRRAMQFPRCGLPSCKPGIARIIDPNKRWMKPIVTVGVHRFVDKRMITIADQLDAIQQALDAWQQGSKLRLRLAKKSERPDIVMTTSADKTSGLGTPGNTLGYAYPPQGDDAQCRIVIDEVEAWTLFGDGPGYNFLGAFSHEMGHAIGHDHQPAERKSLMAAIYSESILLPTEWDRQLTRRLYGAAEDANESQGGESQGVNIARLQITQPLAPGIYHVAISKAA